MEMPTYALQDWMAINRQSMSQSPHSVLGTVTAMGSKGQMGGMQALCAAAEEDAQDTCM